MQKEHQTDLEEKVKPQECFFCRQMFPSLRDLHTHEFDMHKSETIKCDICGKEFSRRQGFKNHMNVTHRSVAAGFCEICQKNLANLKKHTTYHHDNPKCLPCSHCEKVFKDPWLLRVHMDSVNGTTKKKKCKEAGCDKRVVNLRDHVLRSHKGQTKQFHNGKKCSTCFRFVKAEDYEGHKLLCVREKKACTICEEEVTDVNHHMRRIHSKCKFCQSDFPFSPTKPSLRDHIYSEHIPAILNQLGVRSDLNVKESIEQDALALVLVKNMCTSVNGQFRCSLCDRVFRTKTVMSNHMKFHLKLGSTRTPGTIPCNQCGERVRKAHVGKHECKKDHEPDLL